MDGYTLNAARTIREYESSIQRPKAERMINDSILSALLRGDELPEMDVKAIRQYGIQCSEYLYIDSEKYEQMEKELPRYGGTRFPPALAALSMDIIIPSSYICKMKAEINPKLSDREREHNSLNRTMHIKIADSRRNRLAQDRDKPRNINLRYDDDNHDSQ